jgi:two-component system chemotaxis response regulator CheB
MSHHLIIRLIVDGRHGRLTHGPREHRFQPPVDPLFRTAAEHGERAIGIILSGHMADGTHGVSRIKEAVAMVQDADEAQVPSMPLNAMRHGGVDVDYVLPVGEMARVIVGLLMNGRVGDMKQRAAALRRLLQGSREHAGPRAGSTRKRQAHG